MRTIVLILKSQEQRVLLDGDFHKKKILHGCKLFSHLELKMGRKERICINAYLIFVTGAMGIPV